MRLLCSALLCACAYAQNADPAARIEGRVISSSTGEAVPRARVVIAQGRTETGEDGAFVIPGIPPANGYVLSAQRTGFVTARYPTPITLEAGQVLRDVVLTMTPQGVITGRVTNQSGDREVGAIVTIFRPTYVLGVRKLNAAGGIQTNDQGEYRIASLNPGTYYVVASDAANSNVAASVGNRPREGNVATYFPSAAEVSRASPLEVLPGRELRGIDIQLLRSPTFSIRGRLVDRNGMPLPNRVLMARAQPDAPLIARGLRPTLADGSFDISGLSPGEYVLQVTQSFNPETGVPMPGLVAGARVTIAGADIDGLVVRATSGATITGTIRAESGELQNLLRTTDPGLTALPIRLTEDMITGSQFPGIPRMRPFAALSSPGQDAADPRPTPIQADGTFKIEGAGTSRYFLTVGGLPEGVYVKSVRFGDADVTHASVEVPAGADEGKLEIVVSAKGAEVTGVVPRAAAAIVLLWPATPDAGNIINGIRGFIPDQNGAFRLHSLPPGEYYVAAFQTAEPAILQNYEFLAKFAGQATRLALAEGARLAVEAKLIQAGNVP